jgi:hypothetical protein
VVAFIFGPPYSLTDCGKASHVPSKKLSIYQ